MNFAFLFTFTLLTVLAVASAELAEFPVILAISSNFFNFEYFLIFWLLQIAFNSTNVFETNSTSVYCGGAVRIGATTTAGLPSLLLPGSIFHISFNSVNGTL